MEYVGDIFPQKQRKLMGSVRFFTTDILQKAIQNFLALLQWCVRKKPGKRYQLSYAVGHNLTHYITCDTIPMSSEVSLPLIRPMNIWGPSETSLPLKITTSLQEYL